MGIHSTSLQVSTFLELLCILPAGHFLWKLHYHSQISCSMWISKVQRRWGPPALVLPPTCYKIKNCCHEHNVILYTDWTVIVINFKQYILLPYSPWQKSCRLGTNWPEVPLKYISNQYFFYKKWLILISTAFGIMFWCKTKLLKSILTFTAW